MVRQENAFAEGTRFSGRLCLPDSAGAGPGRLPALLGQALACTKWPLTWPLKGGLPSGRTKWPLTWPLKDKLPSGRTKWPLTLRR